MADDEKNVRPWTPARYRIEVAGAVDASLTDSLGGMQVTSQIREDGMSVSRLEGRLRDQSELSGVLNCLADLRLPILMVQNLDESSGSAGSPKEEKS